MGEPSKSKNLIPLDPEMMKIALSQGIEVGEEGGTAGGPASSSSSSSSSSGSSPSSASSTRNVENIQQNQTQVMANENERQSQEENAGPSMSRVTTTTTTTLPEVYFPFNPQDHGLANDFSLTNYGDIRDQFSCPSHHDLQAMLSTFVPNQVHHHHHHHQ